MLSTSTNNAAAAAAAAGHQRGKAWVSAISPVHAPETSTRLIPFDLTWSAHQPGNPTLAESRGRFMALTALGSGGLFLLVALANTLPKLLLGPCE